MNPILIFIYFIFFALIAGGAFAMMWSNIRSINEEMRTPRKSQHPEAPKEGEEVMYVNLDRERLEKLYEE
jgi:uncharacterized BrkB/YihY/UPF0761 family membrane protein